MHRLIHRGRIWLAAAATILTAFVLMGASECEGGQTDTLEAQREAALKERGSAMDMAEKVAPVKKPVNFPMRKALVEFTERQDMTNHPWYVYILGMDGNEVGYYVAKTVPINACNFLSSTEEIHAGEYGKVVLTAPSLDGMFYGGGGASAGCDAWFFFDYATNALIQIRGVGFFATDVPLVVDAQPIKVKQQK